MSKTSIKPRIIIVDDDMDLLFLLESQLTMTGYLVTQNLGGSGLLDQLNKERQDIVLMDLAMTHANGQQLCCDIKADKKLTGLIVILMSGHHDLGTQANECGADGYIAKPLSFSLVQAEIKKFLLRR